MSVLDRALIRAFEKDKVPPQTGTSYQRQDGTAVRVDVVSVLPRPATSRPVVNEVVPLPPPHLKFPVLGQGMPNATSLAPAGNAFAHNNPVGLASGNMVADVLAAGTTYAAPTSGGRTSRIPLAPAASADGSYHAPHLKPGLLDPAASAVDIGSGAIATSALFPAASILVGASSSGSFVREGIGSRDSTELHHGSALWAVNAAAQVAPGPPATPSAPAAPAPPVAAPHFQQPPARPDQETTNPFPEWQSPATQRASTVVENPLSATPAAAPQPSAATAREPARDAARRVRTPLAAVWEVDRFLWPAACDELRESAREHLEHAGQNLVAACRAGLNVLAISGQSRGEGRSTIALALARAAAEAGASVALIDADLHQPSLATHLQVETPASWLETIARQEPLEEAAIRSLEDSLTLFPLTPVRTSPNPLSLFSQLVRKLVNHFELLILDAPPAFEIASAKGCIDCSLLDAALIVHDLRSPSSEATQNAVNALYRSGIESVGIVENFVTQPRAS